MDAEPRLPAGPRSPAALQSLAWFRDPVGFMERGRSRHGPIFSVRLGPLRRCSFVADPVAAWQVLTGDRELMRMGSANGIFRPVLGENSLFLLDGEDHKRHRKLLMPAFHRGAVERWSGLVAELARRELARWPLEQRLPLQGRMRALALEVILRVVIGATGGSREDELRAALGELLERVQNPIAVLPAFQRDLGGRSPFARMMAVVERIDGLIYEEIGERRYASGLAERDDVLSMLVRPRVHEPGFLSDREVRDEMLTLLIAGHETTATALAWTFERLLRESVALARLREELDRGPGGPYLEAVITESLRQRPVLPVTARKLTRPIALGPYVFPAHWTLMPCIYLIHNDPAVFPDAERFLPERFLGASPAASRVWIPFGAGPRHCIGYRLSLMIMREVVAAVVGTAELEPAAAEPERIVRRNFTLNPEHGAAVVVRGRREPGVRRRATAPSGG